MKEKLKKLLQFLMNPRFILCFGIGWMITNGWSYIMFGVGTYFGIEWMVAVAGAYLTFLWLPISPEKIVTFGIAIILLRVLFPNDQKTLAVLMRLQQKAKDAFKLRKAKKAEEKQRKEEETRSDEHTLDA